MEPRWSSVQATEMISFICDAFLSTDFITPGRWLSPVAALTFPCEQNLPAREPLSQSLYENTDKEKRMHMAISRRNIFNHTLLHFRILGMD